MSAGEAKKGNGRRTVEAAVGYVRALSGTHAAAERGWVDCPHSDSAVELERCHSCSACASMSFTKDGHVRSLRCFQPREQEQENPHRTHYGLMTDVPTVAELMTRDVLCVQPDLSVDAVLSLFAERGFKAVPVVKPDATVLGVVSEADVLAYIHARGGIGEGGDAQTERYPEAGMHEVASVTTVDDVMMPLVLAVPEDMPVTQASALMAFEAIHRLVVRNASGKLVGLLSASDVLAWLGRCGGYGD